MKKILNAVPDLMFMASGTIWIYFDKYDRAAAMFAAAAAFMLFMHIHFSTPADKRSE